MTNHDFGVMHARWLKCLESTDSNSIVQQLHRMTWMAAVYNVVNEARALAQTDSKGEPELNPMLHELIDITFFESQFMAIRRLTDERKSAGPDGVYSVSGLLKELKKHRHLLTRKNLMAAAKLEYDPEPIKARHSQYVDEQLAKGLHSFSTPRELDYRTIERRHADLDYLCGVKPDARSPSDTMQLAILEQLERKLDTCEAAATYVNAFLAHAASEDSNSRERVNQVRLTLGHLRDAHEILCRVTSYLSVYVVAYTSQSYLPHPQFNHLEHLDEPMVRKSDMPKLHKIWQAFDALTSSWSNAWISWANEQNNGFMLDTTVFNHILRDKPDISRLTTTGRLFVTHVQHDEIINTQDLNRRQALLEVFHTVPVEKLPTESAVWDVSKFDEAKWGAEDGLFQSLLDKLNAKNKRKDNNPSDILIAETAIRNGLTLVTDDSDLLEVVNEYGGKAVALADFLAAKDTPTTR
ncbi:MAG: type II toxin-antitoxin system VapC family toxin [Nevskiales bacterium]